MLASVQNDPAESSNRLGQALSLFMIITIVLGILVVGAVLAMIAHRLRRTRRLATPSTPMPDPWKEAGQRVQAFETRSDE